MMTDPVCGMTVDEKRAAGKYVHKGTTLYFCSSQCLRKFEANPDSFAQPAGSSVVQNRMRDATTDVSKSAKPSRKWPRTRSAA